MGLLDKFKNLFTDEEVVEITKEIEVGDKIEPPKLPKVMQEQIEKLELTKQIIKDNNETDRTNINNTVPVSDRELIKTKTRFNFPVEFNDEEISSNRNVLTSRVSKNSESSRSLYNMSKEELDNTKKLYGQDTKTEEKIPEKKFYSSPVISPVYGILDKNYKKEELRAKDENSYEIPRTNKKVDFESVRKKAFGSLADEIKDSLLCDDCELKKASLKVQKQVSDDLLYDITIEKEIKEKENEEIEDNYNDFGVSYEVEDEATSVVPTKIDIDVEIEETNEDNESEEKEEEKSLADDILNSSVEIVNCNDNEIVAEKIEVKEPIEEDKKIKDNLELTDDLFNLIDSMYQDKEE